MPGGSLAQERSTGELTLAIAAEPPAELRTDPAGGAFRKTYRERHRS